VSSFDNFAKLEVKLPHWRAINDETALVKTSLECASVYYSILVLRLMNDKDTRHKQNDTLVGWSFRTRYLFFPLLFVIPTMRYSALLSMQIVYDVVM